jgi:hypothetical protein
MCLFFDCQKENLKILKGMSELFETNTILLKTLTNIKEELQKINKEAYFLKSRTGSFILGEKGESKIEWNGKKLKINKG